MLRGAGGRIKLGQSHSASFLITRLSNEGFEKTATFRNVLGSLTIAILVCGDL
jgi:hypothetical protein